MHIAVRHPGVGARMNRACDGLDQGRTRDIGGIESAAGPWDGCGLRHRRRGS